LDDLAAEPYGVGHRRSDVVDADEEGDQVAVALQRADGAPKNARVPSGSLDRISAWTMG
jgi:hypothetical protein